MNKSEIPFIDLKVQFTILEKEIRKRMDKVLLHGQFIMGPEVHELENELSTYTGAKYCISVASGTEALLISLMALGVGPGDEVITTPFSFAATVEVIVLLGATPVFVDICRATCNINSELIEQQITSKTKVILPVSLYGQPANMDVINSVSKKYGLTVIEDAAQSFGADYKGTMSCNLSKIGCTSFFPSKPLGCYGDGGAIFTSDSEIAEICREIRVHGQSKRYTHTRIGVGGRMDTLQCAIVLAKLEQFKIEIVNRRKIGAFYNKLMEESNIDHIIQTSQVNSVYAQYTISVEERELLVSKLKCEGIPTSIHYPIPLNEQSAYVHLCNDNKTPIAKEKSEKVLSIPMHPYLDETTQRRIVNCIAESMIR